MSEGMQAPLTYRPRCGNNCNNGFRLRMVRISALKPRVPVHECKDCGYWVISKQCQVFCNTGRVFPNNREYEEILGILLKERT